MANSVYCEAEENTTEDILVHFKSLDLTEMIEAVRMNALAVQNPCNQCDLGNENDSVSNEHCQDGNLAFVACFLHKLIIF